MSQLTNSIFTNPKLHWMHDENIRPYVFVRPENRIPNPGALHTSVDWFKKPVVYKNPLEMDQVVFADRILSLESRAFGPSGMAMARWVFYDCAIVPGFVAGFAVRTASLTAQMRDVLLAGDTRESEWTPLSLFIIIPTMSEKGEWVAHNLCSVNSLLPKADHYYGIGFISKAFGLWYANVRTCCGMTQWTSPSVKLHSNYGDFEVLTSYTPVHSFSRTLTYRLTVEPQRWAQFFTKNGQSDFVSRHREAGFTIDPTSEQSMIDFQHRLERGDGPFFLDSQEILQKDLTTPLTVYHPK
jgi:hypothetical protein